MMMMMMMTVLYGEPFAGAFGKKQTQLIQQYKEQQRTHLFVVASE